MGSPHVCNEPLQLKPHGVVNPNRGIRPSFARDIVIRFTQCWAQGFVCAMHHKGRAGVDKFILSGIGHGYCHGIRVNVKPDDQDTGTGDLLLFLMQ